MDLITAIILWALRIITESTGEAIEEASKEKTKQYLKNFKDFLSKKFGQNNKIIKAVEELEQKPDSKSYKIQLQEAVQSISADQQPDIKHAAQNLLKQIREETGDYWINQIILEHERLNQTKKKLKWWQIITTIFIVAVIIMLLVIEESKLDGKKLCESLSIHGTGNDKLYHLYQPYLFVETPTKDARSIVSSATWTATNCKTKENGDYVLEGKDESTFTMEVLVNGKYEQIGPPRIYTYDSWVNIRKDGTLLGRSYNDDLGEKHPNQQSSYSNSLDKKLKSFIDTKIKELNGLRDQKHSNIQKQYCTSMQGEKDGNTMLAFVCDGYTRVMIKK